MFVDGDVELTGHEHLRAIVHAVGLPVFGGESEARHAADDAFGVDAQGEFEVFLDFAEELSGVDDLDGLLFQPEIARAARGRN